MNSAALPRQLLRRHQCETAFSSRFPNCDASGEDNEPQLKVRACPIKIPRPTKTSLVRQAQIRASSDISGSDSEVPQNRPRRERKKGSKNSPLLPGMESGQGDLDASTVAKRLRVRKEIQHEPSGLKVDTKTSPTPNQVSDEISTEISSSEREASV